MRWLMGLLLLGVLVGTGMLGAGSVLPTERTLVRGVFIKAKPEEVFQAISAYEFSPSWNPSTATATRLKDMEGHAMWKLTDAGGRVVRLQVVEDAAPNLHHIRLIDHGDVVGEWIFQLAPQPDGTFVKLTEKRRIGNPLTRFVSKTFGEPDGGMRQYLEALARKFKQDPIKIEALVA